MQELTIRVAREGSSFWIQTFAYGDEILAFRRGRPVVRILPMTPRRRSGTHEDFLQGQTLQTAPSEARD